jgi:hypothetical protein
MCKQGDVNMRGSIIVIRGVASRLRLREQRKWSFSNSTRGISSIDEK